MTTRPNSRFVASLLVVAVVTAVGAGLLLVGPPSEERARRRDSQRVRNLADIGLLVDMHWTKLSLMPGSLNDLDKAKLGDIVSIDPFTNQPYEYRHVDSNGFELCAVFERDASAATHLNYNKSWPHGTGRVCFSRVARKLP